MKGLAIDSHRRSSKKRTLFLFPYPPTSPPHLPPKSQSHHFQCLKPADSSPLQGWFNTKFIIFQLQDFPPNYSFPFLFNLTNMSSSSSSSFPAVLTCKGNISPFFSLLFYLPLPLTLFFRCLMKPRSLGDLDNHWWLKRWKSVLLNPWKSELKLFLLLCVAAISLLGKLRFLLLLF